MEFGRNGKRFVRYLFLSMNSFTHFRGFATISCLFGCTCAQVEVDLTIEERESPILPGDEGGEATAEMAVTFSVQQTVTSYS